jgi:hypothetical protein
MLGHPNIKFAGGCFVSHFTTKWCNIVRPTVKPYAAKYVLIFVHYCARKLYKTSNVTVLCVRWHHKRKIFISLKLPHNMCLITPQNKGSKLFHCFIVRFNSQYIMVPTNALVCNKTLIQMSHTKTFKITPTCFDHQMIIISEPSDPG